MTIIGGDKNQPSLLSNGALVITDNTLWKGKVIEHFSENNENIIKNIKDDNEKDKDYLRTKAIHEYNINCASHPNLQTVMLPLRDGLTLSRYHK